MRFMQMTDVTKNGVLSLDISEIIVLLQFCADVVYDVMPVFVAAVVHDIEIYLYAILKGAYGGVS